jgi:eukaryotic-like serine/threonine-protein kinase
MEGRRLGHYRLNTLIGGGGMGEIYRATDEILDRHVAVKILPPHLASDPDALKRFEREAKSVAALSHPNILSIHDFGIDQGISYAVMELLEGETLRSRLSRSTPDWRQSASVAASIADGLEAAHAKGIIHRDLKPENIFITSDGQVKILDFGIATANRGLTRGALTPEATEIALTRQGVLMGTLGYMSPEQVRGDAVDPSSDLFSLGCVLYEMTSGRRPFSGTNVMEVLAAILRDDPAPLARNGRDVPSHLDNLIHHCLEKEPGKRPQSAAQVAGSLRAILSERQSSGKRWLLVTVAAVAIAGVVFTLYVSKFWRSSPTIRSVAVLPFRLLNDNLRDKPLELGIASTLIPRLSNIREIRVLPMERVQSLSTDLDEMTRGREVRANLVLAGNIQSAGDDVRVNMHLVRIEDQKQIWAGSFDETFTGVLSVQDRVANRAISELTRQLVMTRYTENTEAFDLYSQGRQLLGTRQVEDVLRGMKFFEQAIDRDRRFALAYAGLADAYFILGPMVLGRIPPAEAMTKQKEAATKATELDDALAEAHTSLAITKMFYFWEWSEAERELQRALDLYPSHATAHRLYGAYLTAVGRMEQGIEESKRALALEPTRVSSNTLAGCYFLAGRQDEAVAQYLETIKMDPRHFVPHLDLAQVYEAKGMYSDAIAEVNKAAVSAGRSEKVLTTLAHINARSGNRDEAQRLLEELQRHAEKTAVDPLNFALVYAALKDTDRMFEWLEKGFQDRSPGVIYLKVEPRFDAFRSDVRFANLLQRIGLPP